MDEINKKNRKKQNGFTLLEIVIYLAIVSSVLISLVYLVSIVSDASVKNRVMQEVNQNMRLIIERFAYEARRAKTMTVQNSSVAFNIPNNDDITFQFEGNILKLKRGAGQPVNLSSNLVDVTGSFEDISYIQGQRSKHIRMTITVAYKNPGNNKLYGYSESQEISVELRNK